MAKQLDYVGVYLHLQRNEDGSYTKTLQRVESIVRDPAATTVPENTPTPFNTFPAYDGAATVSAYLDTCLQAAKDAAGVV
jgi:hypothetical protein